MYPEPSAGAVEADLGDAVRGMGRLPFVCAALGVPFVAGLLRGVERRGDGSVVPVALAIEVRGVVSEELIGRLFFVPSAVLGVPRPWTAGPGRGVAIYIMLSADLFGRRFAVVKQ